MMNRLLVLTAVIALTCLAFPGNGLSISSEAIVQLKRAGLSDTTIQLIISERTIETAAFSVEELLALKKAGIGEKTLQAIIQSGSFLQGRDPIVYGRAVRPIRLSSVEDIIEMHRAGFSDTALQAVLEVANPSSESDRQRALDMLESMNIRVDFRGE